MSAVTENIALYWAGRGDSTFLTRRSLFTPEDQYLIDAGVFTVADRELRMIECPFGCGEMESIILIPKPDGTKEHFLACQDGEGMMVLEPEQYQLMKFNPEAYGRYCQKLNGIPPMGTVKPKRHKPIKKRGPKNTRFMQEQREEILEYVTVECHRHPSSVATQDCAHVWNLPRNKVKWDRHARYTDDRRGYGNPKMACKSIHYHLKG